MLGQDPFFLWRPRRLDSAAVFSSPHSGREYPAALRARSRLSYTGLRASEDAYVDDLFRPVVDYGAPLLAARAPRAFVDLNRGPEELDPAIVDGVRATGLNPRVAAGLGVVPRIVAEGRPIQDGKISLREAQERIASWHRPYHDALSGLLSAAERRFGFAILFDCHSMPSDALRSTPRVGGKRPDIVLGDRFGASAGRDILDATYAAFTAAGFTVTCNAPFAGGHITQRYGRPGRGRHAIQIEIDRGLYLDQGIVRRSDDYDDFAEKLAMVLPSLASIGRADLLAAE